MSFISKLKLRQVFGLSPKNSDSEPLDIPELTDNEDELPVTDSLGDGLDSTDDFGDLGDLGEFDEIDELEGHEGSYAPFNAPTPHSYGIHANRWDAVTRVQVKDFHLPLRTGPESQSDLLTEVAALHDLLHDFHVRSSRTELNSEHDHALARKIFELRQLIGGTVVPALEASQAAALSVQEHKSAYEKDRADRCLAELEQVSPLINAYKSDIQTSRAAHAINHDVAEYLHKQVQKSIRAHPRANEMVSDIPGLRTTAIRALGSQGIETLADLCLMTRNGFLSVYEIGPSTLDQVVRWLDENEIPHLVGAKWLDIDPGSYISWQTINRLMKDRDYEWLIPSIVEEDAKLSFELNDQGLTGVRVMKASNFSSLFFEAGLPPFKRH